MRLLNISAAVAFAAARGFSAASVMRGAAATPGTPIFTLPGYGQTAAALAPRDSVAGLLVYQPIDGATSHSLDVISIAYSDDAGIGPGSGAPTPLLQLTTPNTPLWLMTDSQDRLWVAVSGLMATTYVVLTRR